MATVTGTATSTSASTSEVEIFNAQDWRALCLLPPDTSHGTPSGIGDFRLSVELALPQGKSPSFSRWVTDHSPMHALVHDGQAENGDWDDLGSATTTASTLDPTTLVNIDSEVFAPWNMYNVGAGMVGSGGSALSDGMDWESDTTGALYIQLLFSWLGPGNHGLGTTDRILLIGRGGSTNGQALWLTDAGQIVISANSSSTYDDQTVSFADAIAGPALVGPGVHHIAARIPRSGGYGRIWLNGALVAESDWTSSITDGTVNPTIGRVGSSYPKPAGSDTAVSLPANTGIGYVVLDAFASPSTPPGGEDEWVGSYYAEMLGPHRRWVDVTSEVQGLAWERGATEPHGITRPGGCAITLDGTGAKWDPTDEGTYTSWDYTAEDYGPGIGIRIGLRSSTSTTFPQGWLPLFTGLTETWEPRWEGNGAARQIDVSGIETLSWLATVTGQSIVDNFSIYPAAAQIETALIFSSWPFGLVLTTEPASSYGPANATLDNTDLSANRLTEVQMMADSAKASWIRSRPDGRAEVLEWLYPPLDEPELTPLRRVSSGSCPVGEGTLNRYHHGMFRLWRTSASASSGDTETGASAYTIAIPYDPDRSVWAQRRENITTVFNGESTSSSSTTKEGYFNPWGVARWGIRDDTRTDYRNNSTTAMRNTLLWKVRMAGYSAYSVEALVQVHDLPADGLSVALTPVAADVGSWCEFHPPDGSSVPTTDPVLAGRVARVSHLVTPLDGESVLWEATFGLEIMQTSGLGEETYSTVPEQRGYVTT